MCLTRNRWVESRGHTMKVKVISDFTQYIKSWTQEHFVQMLKTLCNLLMVACSVNQHDDWAYNTTNCKISIVHPSFNQLLLVTQQQSLAKCWQLVYINRIKEGTYYTQNPLNITGNLQKVLLTLFDKLQANIGIKSFIVIIQSKRKCKS